MQQFFNQHIAARVLNGLFPAAWVLGPAVVFNIFFVHQRGRAMGVLTVRKLLCRAKLC